jgi:succinate dehydrogenase / fumarate reductase cytochrome b subunit
MLVAEQGSKTEAGAAPGGFLRSRLGSLLAVVPLALWTVVHLWNNLAAFRGGEAWEHAVTEYTHPVAQLATGIVVLLPLVLHSAWGVGRLLSTRPNNLRYSFYANLKYLLQRLSAVGLLLFLGAHLWLAMLKPRLQEGHAEPFADIAHQMRTHVPTLAVYLLGTLALAYHLANGVETFAMGWGLVSSRRALKKLERGVVVVFVLLLGMAWAAIYALWSAGAAA